MSHAHFGTRTLLFITLVLLSSHGARSQAGLSYRFVDGAAGDQNGHTIEGFIEFDEACGRSCTIDNLVGFELNVSGSSSFSYTSENTSASFVNNGQINVSPTAVSIEFSDTADSGSRLTIGSPLGVEWYSGATTYPPYYLAEAPTGLTVWDDFPADFGTHTIAIRVPEPGAALLCLAAVLGSIVSRRALLAWPPRRVPPTVVCLITPICAPRTNSIRCRTPSPRSPVADWSDTQATLHLWTQVVGKVRTVLMPWTNHSWHTTLYVTPRGLTTLAMPHGDGTLQIDFDFVDHRLTLASSGGGARTIELEPISVADFHRRTLAAIAELGPEVFIHGSPNEVEQAIPFAEDTEHASYDAGAVERLRQALAQTDRVMKQFRAGFRGKCSPVHFFWGSFDLAVTRFSGRTAPDHPGGFPNMPDWITREAYSHEVSSCGYWPGASDAEGFFYSYAYPTPDGFADRPAGPATASWSKDMGEFILPYSAVQQSATPEADLLKFFQATYEAAAETADWDRAALEWDGPVRG